MDQPSITLIRPSVSQACVIEKISELYQLEVLKIRKLEGYDDLNFSVECKSLEDGGKAEKYVCKIMNNVDSLETGVIEAHHQMMERLHEGGIVVSQPVLNIRKQYFTTERFNDVGHVFRLLTYIEGSIEGFKGFENEALRARKCSWMLKNAPKIIQFLPAIGDTGRQEIVKSFVKEFDELVTPVIPCLESGVIHGDMNGHNLLVDGTRIAGLIDFADQYGNTAAQDLCLCQTVPVFGALLPERVTKSW
ncbi:Phosphotransferase enzyme family [Nesidiocoris tenuis]|uniref:Hydroxylysine kinase n=1 Tax=Nesidiocoris tenuis TaxID=355587 RepID=A0ABN7ACC4_9HEMI|nr:Phosphotransferase enzyme family [Nesidiocoris tenuis]